MEVVHVHGKPSDGLLAEVNLREALVIARDALVFRERQLIGVHEVGNVAHADQGRTLLPALDELYHWADTQIHA